MARVFYVGDWAMVLGPIFAETPFNYAYKGLETFRYDHYLRDAIESTGAHSCDTCSTWDFYAMPPGRYEEILETYDVVVFSDVEVKNFQLAPQFFDRKEFGSGIITYPDVTWGGMMTCALHHNASNASASARSAIFAKVSGVASLPRTTSENPNFMVIPLRRFSHRARRAIP